MKYEKNVITSGQQVVIFDHNKKNSSPVRHLQLSYGHQLKVENDAEKDILKLSNHQGDILLSILLTEGGPILRFQSAHLEFASTKAVSFSCERFQVNAQHEIALTTEGDLHEHIGGDVTRIVEGSEHLAARDVQIDSHGNINLEANDDVDIKAERIRLNCDEEPLPLDWNEFISRTK